MNGKVKFIWNRFKKRKKPANRSCRLFRKSEADYFFRQNRIAAHTDKVIIEIDNHGVVIIPLATTSRVEPFGSTLPRITPSIRMATALRMSIEILPEILIVHVRTLKKVLVFAFIASIFGLFIQFLLSLIISHFKYNVNR